MFRSLFTVSGFTLLSRILGFARDVLIARYLGAGAAADVWVAAFRLPNLFRRIFGEGAFNAAFVPMYSRRLEEDGETVADNFARRALSVMGVILLVLFVLAFIFMEPLMLMTNWGFDPEDGRLEMAVPAGRITIGYFVFICLLAGVSGVLNSRRVFAAPAFAYVVLNIGFLVALIFVVPKADDPLLVLCWAVLISGLVQLLVVLVAAFRRRINLTPRTPKLDHDVRRVGKLMGPGLVSAGIQQLNLIIGQSVASFQIGAVALIFYADRINQLPLGLLGIALGTVLLPEITRQLRGKNPKAAQETLFKGQELALLFCLPAVAAMLVIPVPIMHALFVSGEFTADAAREAGWVLAAFALGTPSYVLARVLQPAFFALEDTTTPMRFTVTSTLVNLVLVYPMFLWLGPTGCALATSIAGWVNLILLWLGLRKLGFVRMSAYFLGRIGRILTASAIMSVGIYFASKWAEPWIMRDGDFVMRVAVLLVLVLFGVILYFAAIFAMRVYRLQELKSQLRRSSRS